MKIVIPPLGESITQATLSNFFKNNKEFVKEGDPIAEIESDKASLTIVAPVSGILEYKITIGSTLKIGEEFASIEPSIDTGEKKYSPAAKKIQEEFPQKIMEGSGKDGMILKQDFFQNVISSENNTKTLPQNILSNESILSEKKEEVTKTPVSKIRKIIAQKMIQSKQEQAILTTFNEVDLFQIQHIRKTYKELLEKKYKISLGYMSFFSKAVCLALQEIPVLHSQLKDDYIYSFKNTHLGIAVATEKGLMVPVIKNANTYSLIDLEKKIQEYALQARNSTILPGDLQGATFTITNGGVFGSLLSTPIVNSPQSAILGMHTIQERPVVYNKEICIRPMMYLALSYDHRLIDGKDSVLFLKKIKDFLEDPSRMLIGV
jgi:2-oxoglutarate dehydrogenase E2 component (dihydrolipoamide succinyltransferase)